MWVLRFRSNKFVHIEVSLMQGEGWGATAPGNGHSFPRQLWLAGCKAAWVKGGLFRIGV